jgi:hypothetical protein
VKWGYTFDKGDIFSGYINELYKLRLSYPKTDPMNVISKLLLNSLYGRFGMKDDLPITTIINKDEYSACVKKHGEDNIVNIIELGDHQLLQFNDKNNLEGLSKDSFKGVNVNIAIASAVTAYARIHMSQFKNNPNLPNLYYTDTDSLYFDSPLNDSFISSTTLGKLKLEGVWDEAVFLSPKVYALRKNNSLPNAHFSKDNKDKLLIKIKGLNEKAILDKNNNITFELFELLLNKDHKRELDQIKWFKSISRANINIMEQLYTLQVTANKRFLVFDNDKLIRTDPFKVIDGVIILKYY